MRLKDIKKKKISQIQIPPIDISNILQRGNNMKQNKVYYNFLFLNYKII